MRSLSSYPAHDGDFSFDQQVEEWRRVPIEGVGYIDLAGLADVSDEELWRVAAVAAKNRYDDGRNPDGVWRKLLGLDSTESKHVLDFGCGFGLESLQFAKSGNSLTLVDINESSVRVAGRMITAHGFGSSILATCVATDQKPYFESPSGLVDVFYCAGVLHHIPYPREILLRAVELLAPGGEIRLMLYTDKAWEGATGEPAPPVDDDTSANPLAPKFRATFDSVGRWADWYNKARLEHRFGDFLDVVSYDNLNLNGVYAAATLRPKAR